MTFTEAAVEVLRLVGKQVGDFWLFQNSDLKQFRIIEGKLRTLEIVAQKVFQTALSKLSEYRPTHEFS